MNADKAGQLQGTMKNLRFGIEVETVGLLRETVARTIQTVVGGEVRPLGGSGSHYNDWVVVAADGRKWNVVYDGSLPGGGAEITSPILTYADLETLQAVVRAAGGRADSHCGIHVHVDGSTMTPKSVKNLVRYVYSREDAIEAALSIKGSDRRARYCRPVSANLATKIQKTRTMADIQKLWYEGSYESYPSRYNSTRYHGVNLNSLFYRGTVEFRWFNGSLHAGVVKAYVQLCLALAARSFHSSAAGQRRELGGRNDVNWILTTQLGLVGDEFKSTRSHLCKHLQVRRVAVRNPRGPRPAQATAAAVAMLGQDEANAIMERQAWQEVANA